MTVKIIPEHLYDLIPSRWTLLISILSLTLTTIGTALFRRYKVYQTNVAKQLQ